jgi:predicted RNA-binding protein Jag
LKDEAIIAALALPNKPKIAEIYCLYICKVFKIKLLAKNIRGILMLITKSDSQRIDLLYRIIGSRYPVDITNEVVDAFSKQLFDELCNICEPSAEIKAIAIQNMTEFFGSSLIDVFKEKLFPTYQDHFKSIDNQSLSLLFTADARDDFDAADEFNQMLEEVDQKVDSEKLKSDLKDAVEKLCSSQDLVEKIGLKHIIKEMYNPDEASDVAKIIGKKGKTINAVRTLV